MTELFCVMTQCQDRVYGDCHADVFYISMTLGQAKAIYDTITYKNFNIRHVKPINKLLLKTKTDESYQTDGLINEELIEKADIKDDPNYQ